MNKGIELVLADVDGTIIGKGGEIDPYLKRTIEQLAEQGVKFTLASGRGIDLITPVVETLDIQYPYVCDNGGNIYMNKDNLVCNFFPLQYTNKIVDILFHEQIPFFCFTVKDGYKYKTSKRFEQVLALFKGRKELQDFDPDHDYDNERTFKITIDSIGHDNMAEIVKRVKEICPIINFKQSEGTLYTITATNATKGEGVKQVAKLMNVDLDKVMVFGDNFNDVSMFEVAKVSIAVANGAENVRNAATYTCGSNEEHGVSDFLKEYFELD